MRILHIIASADPRSGGPIEGILQQERGFGGSVVSELATLDAPDSPFLENFPLRTFVFGTSTAEERDRSIFSRYGFSLAYLKWLRENAQKYDAVIVHCLWNFATMAASIALPKILRKKYYVYPHGMLDPWFAKQKPFKHILKHISWLAVEGRLLANSQAVLFTAHEEKSLAKDQFFGWRYNGVVVGYGVDEPPPATAIDDTSFRSIIPKLGNRRFILFLSRIHPKKGCDLLIHAFARVANRRSDLDLVIAGPDDAGLTEGLLALAADRGVEDRIHCPGMLLGAAKWGAYRAAEAFALPSHQENFGIVIAEALACGLPVLTTNKVNIWKEVEAGGGGIVREDTIEGVSDLLNSWICLTDEDRNFMSKSARRVFDEHFSVRYVTRNFLKLLRENDAAAPIAAGKQLSEIQ